MRTLFNRLSLSSIRSRMLMIALLPALLTEFGLVAYFTSQSLTTAEDAMHARAADAARHLADTLPYALVSGDTAQMAALLKTETDTNRLVMSESTVKVHIAAIFRAFGVTNRTEAVLEIQRLMQKP
jgi:hypothetical protein